MPTLLLISLLALFLQTPRVELRIVSTVPVPGQPASRLTIAPMKANFKGDVFFRPVAQDERGHLISPVIGVAHDGTKITRFDINAVPDFRDANLVDFAPCGDGTLAALAAKPTVEGVEMYLVSFDEAGAFESAARLDLGPRFTGDHVACFRSGQFLVSGWSRRSPFVGIADDRGQLIRRVVVREDPERPQRHGSASTG